MENANTTPLKFAFFGTPDIAVIILDELKKAGYQPTLIITNPDAAVGRKQLLTPPPVKIWAEAHNIPTFQPTSLTKTPISPSTDVNDGHPMTVISETNWDLIIVAAYGKLIPQWILNLPAHGVLNVHPSLLPQLRGASPIRSAILQNIRKTGVTIMQMDAELDHGPIVAQVAANIPAEHWPVSGLDLDIGLAHQGGALLAAVLPKWIQGTITPIEQNHAEATFCTKIDKSMSEVVIDPNNLPSGNEAYQTLLKIRAFAGWPETFFIHNGKRIKIKHAALTADGTLTITRIVPEGKNEMDWISYFPNK